MAEATQRPNSATHIAAEQATTSESHASQELPSLMGFGRDGAQEYDKAVREYLIGLEQLSRALARKRKSEVVSPFDVQQATVFLGADPDRKFRHIGEIGTLLIGAGLAYLGNVIFGSSYTFGSALLVFLPLLVGCILYAFSWGRS
jgi:hypothetical protein